MARFRRSAPAVDGTLPKEAQLSMGGLFRSTFDRACHRVDAARGKDDPRELSTRIFFVVLALSAIGLMLQLSHSSTTMGEEDFWRATFGQLVFRMLGLGALLAGLQLGPQGLRRALPVLLALAITPLRRLSGWHVLIDYRRLIGLLGFFYALVLPEHTSCLKSITIFTKLSRESWELPLCFVIPM